MDIVRLVTPLVSLIFKVFVYKNLYYLELLLLDQTSEQLLIWYIRRVPRVDCGSWIFVVVVVVVITVGSSSPIWRDKSITSVHVLHCSLRFQVTFFSCVQQGKPISRSILGTTEHTVKFFCAYFRNHSLDGFWIIETECSVGWDLASSSREVASERKRKLSTVNQKRP
jgi:hypothetical protein